MANDDLDWKSAARGRRWTTAVAEAVLRAWSSSGLPRSEFATLHDIHEQRLYQWQKRVAAGAAATVKAPPAGPFREVRMPEARGLDCFEVVLPSGLILQVPAGFDGAALNRLLLVLRGNG